MERVLYLVLVEHVSIGMIVQPCRIPIFIVLQFLGFHFLFSRVMNGVDQFEGIENGLVSSFPISGSQKVLKPKFLILSENNSTKF